MTEEKQTNGKTILCKVMIAFAIPHDAPNPDGKVDVINSETFIDIPPGVSAAKIIKALKPHIQKGLVKSRAYKGKYILPSKIIMPTTPKLIVPGEQ